MSQGLAGHLEERQQVKSGHGKGDWPGEVIPSNLRFCENQSANLFPKGNCTFRSTQLQRWRTNFNGYQTLGNPLQCSCLENPRDGGAWWAAVYGVAQSQTQLKRLSSSSSSSSSRQPRRVRAKSLSHVQLFVTLQTVAPQAPLPMGFSRQEYWSGFPCSPPGNLPHLGTKPRRLLHLLQWQAGSLLLVPPGKPQITKSGAMSMNLRENQNSYGVASPRAWPALILTDSELSGSWLHSPPLRVRVSLWLSTFPFPVRAKRISVSFACHVELRTTHLLLPSLYPYVSSGDQSAALLSDLKMQATPPDALLGFQPRERKTFQPSLTNHCASFLSLSSFPFPHG